MPVTPLYPGVYHERLPSGVRSISGVSTSVTVFLGEAPKGSVGTPTRIFNFTEFERLYGGLSAGLDLGYAVRHFYANGGGEAWIIRVAADAQAAHAELENAEDAVVLTLTARDKGAYGNGIAVSVDWRTTNPGDTFNLRLATLDGLAREEFPALSMDSADKRYAVAVINATSALATAARTDGLVFAAGGISRSGPIADVAAAFTPPAGQPPRTALRVQLNQLPPIQIALEADDYSGANNNARLTRLAGRIADKVKAGSQDPVVQSFQCSRDGDRLALSLPGGESARVRVLAASANDAAPALGLGTANGGTETGGAAAHRPVPSPAAGSLTGKKLANDALDALPAAGSQKIRLLLDALPPADIDIGAATTAAGNIAARLGEVAARLTTAVRAARSTAAFAQFEAIADTGANGPRLVLSSGTRGSGSSVAVAPFSSGGTTDALAEALGLVTGATAAPGKDQTMQGGQSEPVTADNVYATLTGADGLQRLAEIDSLNLIAMPGVTDASVLAEAAALAERRRAFLIIDPPDGASVGEMEALAVGNGLPKSINAAVYYPRIVAADPLDNGKARPMPPSGAVAGIYARTDVTRGVWKAPAGTEASVTGALGISALLDDDRNGVLNPLGVNCIRALPIYGVVSWGARTTRGSNEEANEYKYVPVSRLALYLEESLHRGLKWVVFEPNGETLWSQVRLNVGAFMNGLFRQGAFAGSSAREGYFVKCDAETTTPTDQSLGMVNVVVGFAPLRPAEFVIIRLQQMAGQAASAA